MNYTNKVCLCIATLVSFSCLGMMHQVMRDENGFRVFDGQQEHMVKPYFVDSLLKRMNPEQVQRFIERGNRIRAIRLSDGEYRLQAMVPVKGGGPIGFAIGYGLTKALCWSGLIGAGIGAAVVTGGAAAAAVGAGAGATAVATGAAAIKVGALAASASAIAGTAGVAGAGAAAGAVAIGASAGFTAGAAAATAVGTTIAAGAAAGATATGAAVVAAATSAPAAVTAVAAAGGIVGAIESISLMGAWIGGIISGPF